MILALMRHGAYNDSVAITTDEKHTLTVKGRNDTLVVAKELRDKGFHPAKIVSSPLIRARQTAEIMAEVLGYEGEIEISDSILPSAIVQEMNDTVQQYAGYNDLLLVGHMPSMGSFAHAIITGPVHVNTVMEKSEVIGVNVVDAKDPGEHLRGTLLWRVTPS